MKIKKKVTAPAMGVKGKAVMTKSTPKMKKGGTVKTMSKKGGKC